MSVVNLNSMVVAVIRRVNTAACSRNGQHETIWLSCSIRWCLRVLLMDVLIGEMVSYAYLLSVAERLFHLGGTLRFTSLGLSGCSKLEKQRAKYPDTVKTSMNELRTFCNQSDHRFGQILVLSGTTK